MVAFKSYSSEENIGQIARDGWIDDVSINASLNSCRMHWSHTLEKNKISFTPMECRKEPHLPIYFKGSILSPSNFASRQF